MEISTLASKSLQILLITYTSTNDLLLELTWFLSVGAHITLISGRIDTQVVIDLTNEDSIETVVEVAFFKQLNMNLIGFDTI